MRAGNESVLIYNIHQSLIIVIHGGNKALLFQRGLKIIHHSWEKSASVLLIFAFWDSRAPPSLHILKQYHLLSLQQQCYMLFCPPTKQTAWTMNYKSLALGSRALALKRGAYPQTHSPSQNTTAEKWEIIYGSLFARAQSFESQLYDFSSPAPRATFEHFVLIYGPKQQ